MDQADTTDQRLTRITAGPRLRAALVLALIADILQMIVFPFFVEGAASPADDLLDLGMCGILSFLLGWRWEFAPSFLAKLVPGLDLVPLWTLAVANVYRKERQLAAGMPHGTGPSGAPSR